MRESAFMITKVGAPPQLTKARQVFADSFPTPEAKSEHYLTLGRRSAEGRVVLSADEASTLGEAYALLSRIAARGKIPTSPQATAPANSPDDALADAAA
jgi:hypothetical protein